MTDIDPTLVRDVDLLCLDAGNTVVFFDHERFARACEKGGFATTREGLVRAEGDAKHALERGELVECEWSESGVASARGWGALVGTMLHYAGLGIERLPRLLDRVWQEHQAYNLWSLVPDGLAAALSRARDAGVRIAVVSNSEGNLEPFLERVGLLGAIDLVVDSGRVGVEKPDPRIFRIALDAFGLAADRALHLGDNFATDVLGARAAGVRAALVDPFGHLAGRHPDVARVAGAPEVARAIAEVRGG